LRRLWICRLRRLCRLVGLRLWLRRGLLHIVGRLPLLLNRLDGVPITAGEQIGFMPFQTERLKAC
jgi:hypothetical protein